MLEARHDQACPPLLRLVPEDDGQHMRGRTTLQRGVAFALARALGTEGLHVELRRVRAMFGDVLDKVRIQLPACIAMCGA